MEDINALESIQHLVRYAHFAYRNRDGTEFRGLATDLKGHFRHRNLQIRTPFLTKLSPLITSNTHVHLGIRNNDTLVLAFRGTDFPLTLEDWIDLERWCGFVGNLCTDISYSFTPISWDGDDLAGSLAHEGFLEAFNNQHQKLRDNIHELVEGEPRKVEVCGHGLGGALATLCALWCRGRWPKADITCVTLGSPRVLKSNTKAHI
jgi:hypothetical protein